MERTQGLAFAGLRRKKDPSFAMLFPFSRSPMARGLLFPWEHSQAVRAQSKGRQAAVALLLRSLCNHHGHLRVLDATVDLVGVRHPLHQLLRRWPEGQ